MSERSGATGSAGAPAAGDGAPPDTAGSGHPPLLVPEASLPHNSAVVSASLLLSALLGAGQALLLVFIVGEGDRTDAFLAAYALYSVFAIFGASMRSSIVPLLGSAESEPEFRVRLEELAGRVGVLGLAGTAALLVISPAVGHLLTLGLPSDARWITVWALVMLAPAAYLQIHAAALAAVLAASRRFTFSAWMYVVASAVALAASAVLLELLGVLGAGIGLLIGAVLVAVGHNAYLHRFGVRLRLHRRWLRDRRQREVALFVIGAAALPIALQLALAIALASLSGHPGAITSYSYAFFLVTLMLTISSVPLGLVSMPELVADIARRGPAATREYLLNVTPYAFAVLAPLVLAFVATGKPLLDAIFADSLSDESVDLLYEVGLILCAMTVPMTFVFLGGAVTLALGLSGRFLRAAAVVVGVQAALAIPLAQVDPLAVAAGHVVTLTMVAALLLRWTFGRGWAALALTALWRSAPAVALAGVFLLFRLPLGSDPGAVAALAAAAAGFVAYSLLALLLWPSVSGAFLELVRRPGRLGAAR